MSTKKLSNGIDFLMTPGQRLREIFESEGWTQTQLAELGKTTQPSVARYLNEERKIDFDFAYNLQKETGYHALWILAGEEPKKVGKATNVKNIDYNQTAILEKIMEIEGWNQTQLANEVEINKSMVSLYLKQERRISFDFAYKLFRKRNYNAVWILSGEGPIHAPKALLPAGEISQTLSKWDQEQKIIKKLDMISGGWDLLRQITELNPSDLKKIKIYVKRLSR
ncbi:helix-turn-helix transcriptional regulator [Leptospira santarosai]|uniref:helix-turn-helix transcriptional regulator n=1 Tax=Leptospira santarosai TaxID=28183 RepID=UPI0024AFDBAD|nr:helix-turn-helix transcriptional regulator [Leptospira santarosai]MDI7156240.1 helix-turn-helix transcriptional regulator [Leptospira santarosai]